VNLESVCDRKAEQIAACLPPKVVHDPAVLRTVVGRMTRFHSSPGVCPNGQRDAGAPDASRVRGVQPWCRALIGHIRHAEGPKVIDQAVAPHQEDVKCYSYDAQYTPSMLVDVPLSHVTVRRKAEPVEGPLALPAGTLVSCVPANVKSLSIR
jgi:hypothetical protein